MSFANATPTTHALRSVVFQNRPDGCVAFEADTRFTKERKMEGALRICGAIFVLVGIGQLAVGDLVLPQAAPASTRLALMGLLIGLGLALYFYAARGFQHLVHINTDRQELVLEMLNSKSRSLYQQRFGLHQVESMFVKRGQSAGQLACLMLRRVGSGRADLMLRGEQADLETLHREMCQALAPAPKAKAKTKAAPRRVRRVPGGLGDGSRHARPRLSNSA